MFCSVVREQCIAWVLICWKVWVAHVQSTIFQRQNTSQEGTWEREHRLCRRTRMHIILENTRWPWTHCLVPRKPAPFFTTSTVSYAWAPVLSLPTHLVSWAADTFRKALGLFPHAPITPKLPTSSSLEIGEKIMLRNRCWPTPFHTIRNRGCRRTGRCDQPRSQPLLRPRCLLSRLQMMWLSS